MIDIAFLDYVVEKKVAFANDVQYSQDDIIGPYNIYDYLGKINEIDEVFSNCMIHYFKNDDGICEFWTYIGYKDVVLKIDHIKSYDEDIIISVVDDEKELDGKIVLSYSDFLNVSSMPIESQAEWFADNYLPYENKTLVMLRLGIIIGLNKSFADYFEMYDHR